MLFTEMTGRELLEAHNENQNNPRYRSAFMSAILDGKFQGMTQECFNNFKDGRS